MQVASVFVDLQEQRHRADYDLSAKFLRHDVINLIDLVDAAMKVWNGIRNDPAARLYLLSLLVWDRIRGR
jgi:hypothetical protein